MILRFYCVLIPFISMHSVLIPLLSHFPVTILSSIKVRKTSSIATLIIRIDGVPRGKLTSVLRNMDPSTRPDILTLMVWYYDTIGFLSHDAHRLTHSWVCSFSPIVRYQPSNLNTGFQHYHEGDMAKMGC